MTIELPRTDADAETTKGLRRRQVLKAGAWAAPVIVLTAAAPAAQASPGPVPAAQLTVTAGALTNSGSGGALGPLVWAGGSIAWSRATPGQPTIAAVSYTVALTGPGGLNVTLVTSATNIANGGSVPISGLTYGTAPLAAGAYTITLTAIASDGSKSATSSVTLVAPAIITAVATATYQGQGNSRQDRIAATFTSTFTTPQTLTLVTPLPALAHGSWQQQPPATVLVAPGVTAAVALGRTSRGVAGDVVTFSYSVPGGGTVPISVVLPI
jgi:hypothetical protein